jgi:hypothetical protein
MVTQKATILTSAVETSNLPSAWEQPSSTTAQMLLSFPYMKESLLAIKKWQLFLSGSLILGLYYDATSATELNGLLMICEDSYRYFWRKIN